MELQIHTLTDLIFHGHFYQPPRENPLVEIIPKQPSAKPYQDWNERIYDDCYRANAFSRYLDGYGHVRDIVNNYEYISYNFGPTLLIWMEKHHPETYRKILDADKKSLDRLGHGNAMAQAYNHTILPLASPTDAQTQILWGIDDFTRRFNRAPEGMWLPETAIDSHTIDLLATAGIQFVVLSPWQCKKIENTDGTWKQVHGNDVPYQHAYILEGAHGGKLSAFFYHPELASSISFGHMLRDADAMYRTLEELGRKDSPALIHTATDGEIYGHHEPYGDMALAALIRKVHDGKIFNLTNYATFLEKHPARLGAILHQGEDGRGTSWSCSHGVSRWYKDCGCHTGGEEGWNQAWRSPLREAFDLLGTEIDSIFNREVSALFHHQVDPQRLLHGYSEVLGGFTDVGSFIQQWEKESGIPVEDHRKLAELLEGQRFKQYVFTSCGWFFSDISGIEPRQNIHYAVRAIDLYQRFSETDLLGLVLPILGKAKSNRKHDGSGQTIAKSFVSNVGGEAEAGAYFLMNQNFARPEDIVTVYGKYQLTAYKSIGKNEFTFELLDTRTLRQDSLHMLVDVLPENGYEVIMHITDTATGQTTKHEFSTAHIPPRILDDAYSWIDRSLSRIGDEELEHIATDIRHYSLLVRNGRSAPSEKLYVENMGTCLRALRSLFTTPNTLPWQQKRDSISHLLEFIKRKGRQNEHDIVRHIFSTEINRVATNIRRQGFSYERGSYLLELLNVARTQGIQPSITYAQEALYAHILGPLRPTYQTPLTKDVIEHLHVALNFSPDGRPVIA
ncbi:MAG: hypothetical protein A2Y31_13080 [Spirochaetes bacterium GWC2_52_13]|nr:MAG: hypothetical protein A2Y31_13080 [Spirochaetes bacterium GWC2_52_13]